MKQKLDHFLSPLPTPPPVVEPRINDTGLSTLYASPDAIVDIVFVHGLQGHPRKTWACSPSKTRGPPSSSPSSPLSKDSSPTRNNHESGIRKLFHRRLRSRTRSQGNTSTSASLQSNESVRSLSDGGRGVFWPQDFLPLDCEHSRILTWGYDSMVTQFFRGATNQSNVTAHVRNLLHALKVERLDCQGRRIIFVAHSLGGIIVKDVVRRAAADDDPALLDIFKSTEAILFLGTPHRGSNKAGIAEVARKIVSISGFDNSDVNIRALQINSTEFELLHELFMTLYGRRETNLKVFTFREAKGVVGISYLKMNELVVEPVSSSITGDEPTQTINADHMSMCRFSSRDDEGYRQISGEIKCLYLDIKQRDRAPLKEIDNAKISQPDSPSQATIGSVAISLNDVERKCIALLIQNTSNATDYKSSLPSRVEGTCQWILSNTQYRDWNLQQQTCLLWISGYPGSGKTTLSAYLMEFLGSGERSPASRTTLCYFFCDEKIDTQRDAMAILRSLIHQLLLRRKKLVKYVKRAYDFHGPQLEQNLDELWRIFIAIASDERVGPVSVVVDAMDECEEKTRDRFLRNMIKLVGKPDSPGARAPCIKFLVTSRPFLGRRYTSNLLQIDPSEDCVDQDLKMVIQAKVDGIVQRTRCSPEVRGYLEKALYSKADRTFLWVTLVLYLLEKSLVASQKDFKLIVDQLPKTLTEIYERYLQGIPMNYQPLAKKLLHLIVGSSRPLALQEIRIVIAIERHHHTLSDVEEDAQPNVQETIEGVLGPLVRIMNSQVYLVHLSLKEYLQDLASQTENPLAAKYGVDSIRANLAVAEACASYLQLDDFKQDLFSSEHSNVDSPISPIGNLGLDELEVDEPIWDPFNLGEDTFIKDPAEFEAEACEIIESRYSFYDYAARYWAEHCSISSSLIPLDLQSQAWLLYDTASVKGLNWLRYYWFHGEKNSLCPRDFTSVTTTSFFGDLNAARAVLNDIAPPNNDQKGYALYWAARRGHAAVVDLLLREEANISTAIAEGQNVLTTAVKSNQIEVVKRLLEDNSFITHGTTDRVNEAALHGRTPLSIAAGSGFIEITRLLLQHEDIQPDKADFDQWTPLFWAIGGKHLDILQLLLTDSRTSVTHTDKHGRGVLSWAAADGEVELVKYLSSLKQLDLNAVDQTGRSAFSWAAGSGQLEVVASLRRSQRVDMTIKDNTGRNALSWACSGGHHKVVAYLLKYLSSGIDEECSDGWTPLAWALTTRSPKTVQVLVDSGLVSCNNRGGGKSVLSWAAVYGFPDVVRIFLDVEGIDVVSRDNAGLAPRDYAKRYPEIAEMIDEKIAKLETRL